MKVYDDFWYFFFGGVDDERFESWCVSLLLSFVVRIRVSNFGKESSLCLTQDIRTPSRNFKWYFSLNWFIKLLEPERIHSEGFYFYFYFALFFFKGHARGTWRFPGWGLNQSYGCWPTPQPQPQPCRIRAMSATHTTVHSNARAPTHWARPGIEPASSWILVGFVSTEPRWELLVIVLLRVWNRTTEKWKELEVTIDLREKFC